MAREWLNRPIIHDVMFTPGRVLVAYRLMAFKPSIMLQEPVFQISRDLRVPDKIFAPGEWAAAYDGLEAISRIDKAVAKYWNDLGVKP